MTDRSDWLRARQAGLCGSDIGPALEIAPEGLDYTPRTALDVYLSKVGEPEWGEPSEMMRVGTALEDYVRDRYRRETGQDIAPSPGLVTGPEPWILGTPDALTTDGWVVEMKTTGIIGDGWGEPGTDQIPPHYYAQVLWYCLALGVDRADVVVLGRLNLDLRVYTIRPHPGDVAHVRDTARAWWLRHVVARVPPEVDPDHRDAPADLARLFPSVNRDLREATAQEMMLLEDLARAEGAYRQAKRERDCQRNLIRAAIGDAAGIRCPLGRVLWSERAGSPRWKSIATDLAARAGITPATMREIVATHTSPPGRTIHVRLGKESS